MVKVLPKDQWKSFFDQLSKNLGSKEAEIEVIGQEIGDQLEAKKQLLVGLSYDPKDDEFVITLEHIIQQPKEIAIDEDVDGLKVVEVVEGDGTKHLLKMIEPLALPQ
jgi:hypothetical protein